jgi:hypothetical protein
MFSFRGRGPDYQLAWPTDLFHAEARVLLDRGDRFSVDDATLLLEEAFVGESPRIDMITVPDVYRVLGDAPDPQAFLAALEDVADTLPSWSTPRPYWNRRHAQTAPSAETLTTPRPTSARPLFAGISLDQQGPAERLQAEWTRCVEGLLSRGYLDRVANPNYDAPGPSQCDILDAETRDRLGVGGLWPLQAGAWDEDLFYSLVEMVHDLVARPRRRQVHSHSHHGYHYADFALTPGRALYRWLVNQLLARHDVDLRLADDGEDAGRLVQVAGDDRDELVQRALTSPTPTDRDAVAHAVALFRARAATREDKRSAVAALARIMEDRRRILKEGLLRRDEGALFQIANEFDIRHRGAKQRPDYDEAYLDWVFWWYLATVELTDQLLARQTASTAIS